MIPPFLSPTKEISFLQKIICYKLCKSPRPPYLVHFFYFLLLLSRRKLINSVTWRRLLYKFCNFATSLFVSLCHLCTLLSAIFTQIMKSFQCCQCWPGQKVQRKFWCLITCFPLEIYDVWFLRRKKKNILSPQRAARPLWDFWLTLQRPRISDFAVVKILFKLSPTKSIGLRRYILRPWLCFTDYITTHRNFTNLYFILILV